MNRSETTRQRLQETALRLFSERGFDAVTVEEVARAAGVSHMTFFRNFPTKESVVLDDPYDPLVGAAVAAEEDTLPALERVRRGVLTAFAEIDEPADELMRRKVRLAAGHPGLKARVWENNLRTEAVIVSALHETGAGELEARVAAGAVLGALTAALFDWAESEDGTSLGDRIREALALLDRQSVLR